MQKRRSQAERRKSTKSLLLATAKKLFGNHGYANTSLEDIANDCELTVGPIYHYFDNKLGLFTAVTEQIEELVIEEMTATENPSASDVWSHFMEHCEDPEFRQIILIDGPTVLGTGRQREGRITQAALENSAEIFGTKPDGLKAHMLMGALSYASLFIAENGAKSNDYEEIREFIKFFSNTGKQANNS